MKAPSSTCTAVVAIPLADRFFDAIERNDIAAIRDCYTPDARIWHNFNRADALAGPNPGESAEENLQLLAKLPHMLPGAKYHCWQQETTATGFVRQHILSADVEGAGEVQIPICVICVVADGKIQRLYEYLDLAHLPASVLANLAG